MSASEQIAAYAARQWRTPLSGDEGAAAAHMSYRAFLDTVGVAVAGQREEATTIARAYVAEVRGVGAALDWGTGERLPAEAAALINGIAAHVLDYDDVMTPMRAHVSAILVPALAALAPQVAATGKEYATAFIVGFEVMAKFARVMALDHYTKGWHSTSALGILGTAAACGVLLRLNEAQLCDALGLAVAQASGTRENFGAMAKSFQSAHGAASAVRAALLAQQGFTAATSAIDGDSGYLRLYANGEDMSAALAGLGQGTPEILAIGLDLKKYPCCYAVHRALDGALDMRRSSGLLAADIERIDILTSAGGLQALRREPARTGLEGKFSMEYAIAAALIDGRIGLDSFTDAAVARADTTQLAGRIRVVEAPGPILPRWSEITLHGRDGQQHTRRVAVAHGDAGDPLTDAELIDKAVDCFALAGWPGDARTFAGAVLDMADRPVTALVQACCALAPARS